MEMVGETGKSGIGVTTISLSEELTQMLQREGKRAYHVEWNGILLTGLVRAISACTGQNGVTVFLEGPGRDPLHKPITIERTVGWFTSRYPVNLKNGADIGSTLIGVNNSLRRVPNCGIGYGTLLSYGGEGRLKGLEQDIVFSLSRSTDAEDDNRDEIRTSCEWKNRVITMENSMKEAICVRDGVQNRHMLILLSYNEEKISQSMMIRIKDKYESELLKMAVFMQAKTDTSVFEGERSILGEIIDGYDRSLTQDAIVIGEHPKTVIQEHFMRRGRNSVLLYKFDVYGYSYEEINRAVRGVIEEQPTLRMAYDLTTDQFVEYEIRENNITIPVIDENTAEMFQWYSDMIRTRSLGKDRLLVKIFAIKKPGSFSLCVYAHHVVWDLESDEIFKDRVYDHLINEQNVKVIHPDKEQITRQPSEKMKRNLRAFLDQVKRRNRDETIEKCVFSYYIKNYQVSSASNPIETALVLLHQIAKCHSSDISELPLLMLYHARNSSNNQSVCIHLDAFPLILRLDQAAEKAVKTLEEAKNEMIQEEFSLQWLPELFSISMMREVEGKTPVINIRMHDQMMEHIPESDAMNESSLEKCKQFSLFETTADIYKNGTIVNCVVEKEKIPAIRQTLDKLLTGLRA